MKRGDVYKAELECRDKDGHIQKGVRPLIVISNRKHTKYAPTVTVVPVTSRLKRPWLPTHILIHKGDIFEKDSQTLVESITTIDKEKLMEGEYLGTITDKELLDSIVKAVSVQVSE